LEIIKKICIIFKLIFSSDVLNAIKGELGDVITHVPLAVGQIFDANRFTNLIVPNVPVVCIDNNWQVSTIKQCDQGFVLPQEAGKYLFLGPVVSSALGYVYVSSSYKQLLRVGYQSMFNGNVNINNKMYTNVFLTANHNFNSTIFSFSPITSNMLDVVPDVTNVLSYLSESPSSSSNELSSSDALSSPEELSSSEELSTDKAPKTPLSFLVI
jgi:hypothetical protein